MSIVEGLATAHQSPIPTEQGLLEPVVTNTCKRLQATLMLMLAVTLADNLLPLQLGRRCRQLIH